MAANVGNDLDRGRTIGKYEILTRLSIGGMAELFLAFLPGPGGFRKFVALKQILPDIKKDESFVKMFLDEARITAAFSHSNIGQVFDLGEHEGELYLAMEFIAGQNLEQVVKRAGKQQVGIPMGFACRVVADACLGLHYAHHFSDPSGRPMPVVHRDVSPKNVMVTYGGAVKVIDFGIAKARNRLNRTHVGIVKGTSGYMSPEQVRNEPLDGRTDLFAAAVMLHELLTGQRLFTGANDGEMMLKIAEGEVPQPKNLNPEVPDALNDVVMKALSRKREQRYATGREFARAIEQASPEPGDEEQAARLMEQLFADKIATTRALLELANTDDAGGMTKAVEALSEKEEEPVVRRGTRTSGPMKATGARPRTTTPARRPAVEDVTLPPRQSQKLPEPDLTPPRRPSGVRRAPPKSSREVPVSTVIDDPEVRGPVRKQVSGPVVVNHPEPRGTDPVAQAAPPKSGGGGALRALLVVALLGGLGWAVSVGPLKDVPAVVSLREAVVKVFTDEPPPPPPPTLAEAMKQTKGAKPQFVIEKEAEEARLAEEKRLQAEIEAAANDPERKKQLQEIEAQLRMLDTLEAEQRTLKAEQAAGRQMGEDNSRRIQSLEAQIAELRGLIATKQGKAKTGAAGAGSGEVAVVRDEKTAKAAAVGYVTLYTVNPSNVAVFAGDTSIGTTPLLKVPLEVGAHKLRVVDGENKNRMLSVTVKSGQTSEMKGVDVGSLPLQP